MIPVQRLDYDNRDRQTDFEILRLQQFFRTRDTAHLTRTFRLNFWLLIYITEGCGEHFVDFVEYTYKAGDIVVLQKNQVHSFQVNKQVRGYILIINEPLFFEQSGVDSRSLLDFFNRPFQSPVLTVNTVEGTANRIIMELIYKEYRSGNSGKITPFMRSLFVCFVLSIEENSQDSAEPIDSAESRTYRKFNALLEEHYSTIRSVDEYARLMNVSPKTVNSATRMVAGLSAKEFIIERLVLEIKRYLGEGYLLTSEISDQLGFDEPSNMAKFFKRYVGISPSAFRQSLKK